MKCCGSQLRSEELVVWWECQGKWRENCQNGSEVMERWTDWLTGENVHFFHWKVAGISQERKQANKHHNHHQTTNKQNHKKQGKIAFLVTLVSQKLRATQQWQMDLCFGHQKQALRKKCLIGIFLQIVVGLVCLKVLHTGNHPPLSLSNVSWSSTCCCFDSVT